MTMKLFQHHLATESRYWQDNGLLKSDLCSGFQNRAVMVHNLCPMSRGLPL